MSSPATYFNPSFGAYSADIPIVGDWNGDGASTPGTVRIVGSNWEWHLTNGITGSPTTDYIITFGLATDFPVVGDWDGNGTETPGVARNVGGNLVWYLTDSLASNPVSNHQVTYGISTDNVVAGDWDGNGVAGVGVARSTTGHFDWYMTNALTGSPASNYHVTQYGLNTDAAAAGDWNSDGVDSPGVARGVSGNMNWYLSDGINGTISTNYSLTYGLASDRPVVGDWNGGYNCEFDNSCNPTTFADAILTTGGVGAPATQPNEYAIRQWARWEAGGAGCPGQPLSTAPWSYSSNGAAGNPLNTTQSEPGATDINSVHVKKYADSSGHTCWYWGITATTSTLTNGNYPSILSILRSPSGDATTQCKRLATASDLPTWGTQDFSSIC